MVKMNKENINIGDEKKNETAMNEPFGTPALAEAAAPTAPLG